MRLDEAISLIQRAVKQEPNNGAYLDSLGWAYYKQNKLAEAEENLQKADGKVAHDPTILGHLGRGVHEDGPNRACGRFNGAGSLGMAEARFPPTTNPRK